MTTPTPADAPMSAPTPSAARSRRGFTLLEMMAAVAFSTVVIALLFSAFNLAQGFISTGNRMATENEILVAGYFEAMEDVDYWHIGDAERADPTCPADKKLALDKVYAASLTSVAGRELINRVDNTPTEGWFGWSDRNQTRTLGSYDLTNTTWPWQGRTFLMPGFVGAATDLQTVYDGVHRQYSTAVGSSETRAVRPALANQLGIYAYVWYLPPHALFGSKADPAASRDLNWEAPTGTGVETFTNRMDFGDFTMAGAVDNDKSPAGWVSLTRRRTLNSNRGETIAAADARVRLLALQSISKPRSWPNLAVQNERWVITGSLINTTDISAKSPVTGQLLSLRFRTWGTTVRGMRCNRKLDWSANPGGVWAYYTW